MSFLILVEDNWADGAKKVIRRSRAAEAVMFQRLRAPNDRNGNPRRVYVLMNGYGIIIRAIDEGYQGRPTAINGLVELPEYYVTSSEYRDLVKRHQRR